MKRYLLCASIAILLAPLPSYATLIVSGEYIELTGRINEPISIDLGGRVVLRDADVIAPAQGERHVATVSMPSADATLEMRENSFLTSTNGVPLVMNFRNKVILADNSLVVASNRIAIEAQGNPFNSVFMQDHATVVGDIQAGTSLFIADDSRVVGATRVIDFGDFVMSGGTITNGVAILAGGNHDVDISAGRIDGGFRATGPLALDRFTMAGGEIHGGFTGTALFKDADIFGGSIDGGLLLGDSAPMSFWGGNFNANQDGWLIDVVDGRTYMQLPPAVVPVVSLFGGMFGQSEAGRGIRLSFGTGMDVYGYDLSLIDGLLTGYLSDGNWISLSITTTDDWYGGINLRDVRISVPEPTSLALFLTALGGIFFLRRRKLIETPN